ncbi:DUF1329 domain-containing protein [Pelomonas sp. KK5]|uniref:DUF1329 domain-containing protein n=1 Tax=Pelomonas sp. KK5 TaxID=1855730 RepID=UPI00097C01C2|nr:DUF1329 domain-containing protein [Pelomonas sp. KK5]
MKLAHLPALALCACLAAHAAVSPEEAARLKTDLTPFGAERAGNKDGSIPAWTGGYAQPIPGYVEGGRVPDPFADDKPLFTITAQNQAAYADRLSEASKALLSKYPASYKINVYPTRRSAAAPQWVYDNTFRNATRATMKADKPAGAYGGIPFPIPKTGAEALWNHSLAWLGHAHRLANTNNVTTADGRNVLLGKETIYEARPYYDEGGSAEGWNGDTSLVSFRFTGPPSRVGESLVVRANADTDKSRAWVYFAGQRRTRQLPNACCDTPNPATSGSIAFDETYLFYGSISRYDWTLVGKKELFIPYNQNRRLQAPTDADLVTARHLNPAWQRWELHRVWIVEGALRAGQRHQSPKVRLYLDEDSWHAVLSERYDAQGQLWKAGENILGISPSGPATFLYGFNSYDLLAGTLFWVGTSDGRDQRTVLDRRKVPDSMFTPEAMASESIR